MRKVIEYLISAGIIILIISIVIYYDMQRKFRALNDPKLVEVPGVLTKIRYGRNSTTEFEYDFRGKHYKEYSQMSDVYGDHTCLGEEYMLWVKSDNPKFYIINNTKPIFSNLENTATTSGELISKIGRTEFWEKRRRVRYQYVVDNKLYERLQEIPISDTAFPNTNVGEKYMVRYWLKNPQRAIIYLGCKQ